MNTLSTSPLRFGGATMIPLSRTIQHDALKLEHLVQVMELTAKNCSRFEVTMYEKDGQMYAGIATNAPGFDAWLAAQLEHDVPEMTFTTQAGDSPFWADYAKPADQSWRIVTFPEGMHPAEARAAAARLYELV